MTVFNLYFVYAQGYEKQSSIVVAETSQGAMEKASSHPALKELVELGAQLLCMDIDKALSSQGYTISVSRLGMYH